MSIYQLHHLDELNIENQGSKGRNHCTCTTLAISQAVRDEEAVLATLRHQLQTLGPASDHLLQTEHGGLSTLYAAVEHGTVDEETLVVTLHRILGGRLLTVTLLQHLILQAAGSRDNTFLLGILSQIFLALFLSSLALLGTLCIHSGFLLCKIFLYNLLGITM